MDIQPFEELSPSMIIFFLDAGASIKAEVSWVIRLVEEFVRKMDKASNNEIIKQTRFILDNDGTSTIGIEPLVAYMKLGIKATTMFI